jgi:hypothetical protein
LPLGLAQRRYHGRQPGVALGHVGSERV